MSPSPPTPVLRLQIRTASDGASSGSGDERLSTRMKSLPRPWYLRKGVLGDAEGVADVAAAVEGAVEARQRVRRRGGRGAARQWLRCTGSGETKAWWRDMIGREKQTKGWGRKVVTLRGFCTMNSRLPYEFQSRWTEDASEGLPSPPRMLGA